MSTTVPNPPLERLPTIQDGEDADTVFELGFDGIWRAYGEHGVIAVAHTFRDIYERIGGRWN